MNMRRPLKSVAVVLMLATLLLPAQSVGAGAANISGYVQPNTIHYSTARTIVNNSAPGDNVVFTQANGPFTLTLAAWNCSTYNSFPWGGLNHQKVGELRFVADGMRNGTSFCIATKQSSATYPPGSFSGYLQWTDR